MIVTLKIEDVNPRSDEQYVLKRIREYLDTCDPDERIDVKISRAVSMRYT
jgi:hypothetical protein